MNILSYYAQHYIGLKYEGFTDKLIAAITLFTLMRTPDDEADKKVFEEDKETLIWIEENTHKNVRLPLYMLDRNINPSKKDFKTVMQKFTFTRMYPVDDDDEKITLTENQMQYYLCMAVRKVNEIVMKHLKDYSDEMRMPKLDDMDDDEMSDLDLNI